MKPYEETAHASESSSAFKLIPHGKSNSPLKEKSRSPVKKGATTALDETENLGISPQKNVYSEIASKKKKPNLLEKAESFFDKLRI